MLYCSIHSRLWMNSRQQWVLIPEHDLASLKNMVIESCCFECIYLAKETLRLQFPELYVNIPSSV